MQEYIVRTDVCNLVPATDTEPGLLTVSKTVTSRYTDRRTPPSRLGEGQPAQLRGPTRAHLMFGVR